MSVCYTYLASAPKELMNHSASLGFFAVHVSSFPLVSRNVKIHPSPRVQHPERVPPHGFNISIESVTHWPCRVQFLPRPVTFGVVKKKFARHISSSPMACGDAGCSLTRLQHVLTIAVTIARWNSRLLLCAGSLHCDETAHLGYACLCIYESVP